MRPVFLRAVVFVVFAEKFFGVVEGVDPGLVALEVWGWDPFGVTARVFAGGPAAGSHGLVVGAAAQRQLVDVGGAALRIVGVGGGRSVRACRPGYFPPPRPRTGRAAFTASGSL